VILYSYWRSSAAYRVRIALALKGIDYEIRTVNLRSKEHREPAYLGVNPQGLMPCLIDGDAVLTQSLAIVEYLEERYPEPALLPKDPVDRAKVRAAAQVIVADVHAINNLRVLNYLKRELGQNQAALDAWIAKWIGEGFDVLEASARAPYLFGDSVTLADLCLVPQTYNARRFGVDLSMFPRLMAVERNLLALPAFEAARPENQPDAVSSA
jgi:maleylacetoacetate isomerase/maleylpyruvate isomerase